RQRARPHGARDRRHPRRRHHARGHPAAPEGNGGAPRALRRLRRQGHRARETGEGGFRRRDRAQSLRVRLRHGRLRALAEPSRHLRFERPGPMIAIIGGSGLTQLANLEITARRIVRTPYGEPSGPLTFGRVANTEVIFLARHGYGHTLAPHEINYRANLWALHSKGVTQVLSVCTVGGIAPHLGAGALVLPDQIIDYTWGRPSTFFEGAEQPVTHIDFTEPYDEPTRQMLVSAAASAGVPLVAGGTYAAVQGPRLETKAEIDRLERDGATLVGM